MSAYFWTHMSWFGWIGLSLAIVGFSLAWTRHIQASLACTAFGCTLLGVELIIDRIDYRHVIGAVLMFLYAIVIVVVASIKERKDARGKRT